MWAWLQRELPIVRNDDIVFFQLRYILVRLQPWRVTTLFISSHRSFNSPIWAALDADNAVQVYHGQLTSIKEASQSGTTSDKYEIKHAVKSVGLNERWLQATAREVTSEVSSSDALSVTETFSELSQYVMYRTRTSAYVKNEAL